MRFDKPSEVDGDRILKVIQAAATCIGCTKANLKCKWWCDDCTEEEACPRCFDLGIGKIQGEYV